MKKNIHKLLSAVLATSLLAFTVACGSSNQSSGQSGETKKETSAEQQGGEEIVIKFGHHLPDTHSLGEQVLKFADLVNQKSNGKIKVEVYSNGQLGDQRDLLEGLKLGTVDMSLGDTGVVANYYPEIGILDLPYIFDGMEHSKAALNGPLGEKLKQGILEKAGFRTLGIEALSYRSTVLAKKEVNSFEDFSGLKLRTLQAPQIVETFKSFGVQPVAVPTGEAFSAMQTGVVDGMESNPEFLQSIKVWEVGKYFVDTKHNLTHETINISEQFYQKLPDDAKKIIEESVKEVVEWYHDYAIQKDEEARKALQDNGITFLNVDIEPFKKAALPTTEKFIKDNHLEELAKLIEEAKGKK